MTVKRTRRRVTEADVAPPAPRILVGTASWSDPGFVRDWYPPKLPARERLAWYARHFELVEVNTSYYAIPNPDVVARWVEQTPPGFVFDFKLFQLLSGHRTTVERLPRDLRPLAGVDTGKVEPTRRLLRQVAKRVLDAIQPLRDAGKLGALLLQLTPSFSPKTRRLEELDPLLEWLDGCRLAVELRHRGWVTGDELEKTEDYFRSRRLAFVGVDAPPSTHFMAMPPLDLVTRPDLAYLRAHGRNVRGFLFGKSVEERFDYDYSEAELHEITARAGRLAELASEVHVVYNNNKSDYALRSATRTREIVAEETAEASRGR